MSNKPYLLQGAVTVGAWAWGKYGDQVIERVTREVGKKAQHHILDRWRRFSWDEASNKYRERVQELYGWTRILSKPTPIPLDDIFTEVYILDLPTAYRRYDIKDFQEDPSRLKPTAVPRRSGLDLVQWDRKRLFVLGRPGAGKTTFLRYVTVQCAKENIKKLPIFVGLKDWADSGLDLMSFIARQFDICGFPDALPFVEYVLDNGLGLVLFDGLDEVKQEDSRRDATIDEIKNFTNKYLATQCLVSCRIAATNYTFEHFDYVEIADFTQHQIFAFAKRWFSDDKDRLKEFVEGIVKPENKGLREIASVPILLTLVCLAFEGSGKFPQRRAQVYDEGIDALLKKWDETKKVDRDVYYGLTLNQKIQLLCRTAFQTFVDNKLFFTQKEVVGHITRFLRTVPGYESGEVDGEEVLRSIEAHHGLLSQRSQSIYSFSHLTFQEYFVAREVVEDQTGVPLLGLLETKTVASDRWREVILMTASMLPNATTFFQRFAVAIADIIRTNANIEEMFGWADRKAKQYFPVDRRVAGRLHYLSLALIFDIDRSVSRERARLAQIALTHAEKFVGIFKTELDIFKNVLISFPMRLNKARADNVALELDRAYDLPEELEVVADKSLPSDLAIDLELTRLQFLTNLLTYEVEESPRRAFASKFADYCRSVREKCRVPQNDKIVEFLGEITSPQAPLVKHSRWVRFADDHRSDLEMNRDVGYNWRLSKNNVETLSQILEATQLLYDCLEVSVVDDAEFILDDMFAAPSE